MQRYQLHDRRLWPAVRGATLLLRQGRVELFYESNSVFKQLSQLWDTSRDTPERRDSSSFLSDLDHSAPPGSAAYVPRNVAAMNQARYVLRLRRLADSVAIELSQQRDHGIASWNAHGELRPVACDCLTSP